MSTIRLTNLTGAVEIGANCYSLEIAGKRILLDAGSHPKKEGNDALPRLDLLEDNSVDAIVVSHAHQDHIGSLPVAMRRHPRFQLKSDMWAHWGPALRECDEEVATEVTVSDLGQAKL